MKPLPELKIKDQRWKIKKGQIDKIITNPPALSKNKNPKDVEKLYNEFFYQAEFVLNKKGKIVLITNENSLELLKKAAEKNKFKTKEKREVYLKALYKSLDIRLAGA